MKKLLRIIFVVVLTVALVPFIFTACSQQVEYGIINGDFILRDEDGQRVVKETQGGFSTFEFWTGEDETLPYGYSYYAHHDSSSYKLDRDPPFNRDSRNYFEFKHTVRSYSYLTQKINVKPQTYYQLQLSYRTLGTSNIGNLCFYIGEDPTISPTRVSGNTGLNVGDWKTYSMFIDSSASTEMTIFISFGGTGADLFGVDTSNNASTGSNLEIYGAIGTAQISEIVLIELPAAPNSSNIHSINLNRNNILTNFDMRKRDENGGAIPTGSGYYELNADENGMPNNWSFITNNSDVASLSASTETAETVQISGESITYNSKNNYFKIKHTDFTFSTVYQTVSVKPRTYYLINYNYYIPQNHISFTQSTASTTFGLHLALLQDPLYILNARTKVDVSQQNHYTATASKSISRWVQSPSFIIYSGDNTSLSIGVNFGLETSPVKGEAWVTSFLMRETVPSSEAFRYYIQNNDGYGQNTALESVLLVIFILLTIALFAVFIWAIYLSLAKKEAVKAVVESEESVDVEQSAEAVPVNDENERLDTLLATDQPSESATLTPTISQKESKLVSALLRAFNGTVKFLKERFKNPISLLIAVISVGFLLRLILSLTMIGYRDNIEQTIESILLIKNSGYSGYIISTNYNHMPFYSIILWLFSFVFPSNANLVSFEHILLIKLPTMLADCLTAFVLYLFGKKQSKKLGITMASIYALNPLLILNAVVFRYDTLFILFVILSLYSILNKNLIGLFLFYTLAVMTNIYSLAFAPAIVAYIVVQIVTAVTRIIKSKEKGSESLATLIMMALFLLSSVAVFYITTLSLTYSTLRGDVSDIINYYFIENLSITHFSYNGLNIFTMIGLNGMTVENAPSTLILLIFFVLLTAFCALIYAKNRNRAEIVLTSAFVSTALSVLFINTSDAFILPLIALLIASVALFKDKRIYAVLFSVTMLGFINIYMIMQSANYFNSLPSYLLDSNINAMYDGRVLIESGLPFIQSILASTLFVLAIVFYFTTSSIVFSKKRKQFEAKKPLSLRHSLRDYFGYTKE